MSAVAPYIEQIRQVPLFADVAPEDMDDLIGQCAVRSLSEGDHLFFEDDPPGNFYILMEGEIDILKKDPASGRGHLINTVQPFAVIGELAILDNLPRSASVRAKTDTRVLECPSTLIIDTAVRKNASTRLLERLARDASQKLRHTSDDLVAVLEKQTAMYRFFTSVIVIISLYTFALSWLAALLKDSASTSYITLPLTIVFVAAVIRFQRTSPFDIDVFGFTLKGWKRAMIETALCLLPVIAGIILIKWIAVTAYPEYAHIPLLDPAGWIRLSPDTRLTRPVWWGIYVLVYLVVCIGQEIIARGGLQSSLQQFLVSEKPWNAILISNLIFSVGHLFFSLGFALITFFSGLFFGWLYARHKTLLSPLAAHVVVGFVAFFVMGYSSIFLN